MASYGAQPPKADEVWNQKVIYLCQTRGCELQISEFPAAEKHPAPRKCKLCQNATTREAIENEYDAHKKNEKL
jgi:hypothetical protein